MAPLPDWNRSNGDICRGSVRRIGGASACPICACDDASIPVSAEILSSSCRASFVKIPNPCRISAQTTFDYTVNTENICYSGSLFRISYGYHGYAYYQPHNSDHYQYLYQCETF